SLRGQLVGLIIGPAHMIATRFHHTRAIADRVVLVAETRQGRPARGDVRQSGDAIGLVVGVRNPNAVGQALDGHAAGRIVRPARDLPLGFYRAANPPACIVLIRETTRRLIEARALPGSVIGVAESYARRINHSVQSPNCVKRRCVPARPVAEDDALATCSVGISGAGPIPVLLAGAPTRRIVEEASPEGPAVNADWPAAGCVELRGRAVADGVDVP